MLGIADLVARFFGGFALSVPSIRSNMLLVLVFNEGLNAAGATFLAVAKSFHQLVLASVVFGFAYGMLESMSTESSTVDSRSNGSFTSFSFG